MSLHFQYNNKQSDPELRVILVRVYAECYVENVEKSSFTRVQLTSL
jgi:hypothetical protein